MRIVIITGGIGSGKSVVSRLVSVMGFPTYDCDTEAKRLMDESPELKSQLRELLGNDAYDKTGCLDKAFVASRIFSDKTLLKQMNAIVHPAVRSDIKTWAASQSGSLAFVETALLAESGLNNDADVVWVVDAPQHVRVERVMVRSGLSRGEVEARIASQAAQFDFPGAVHIINDNEHSLIEQITGLLNGIGKM